MSWTSNGFFRNINILKAVTPESGSSLIQIYKPGILNLSSVAAEQLYSGFITVLRAHIDISSLPEVAFPTKELGMSDTEWNALLTGLDAVSPKKILDISLSTSDNPDPTRIAAIAIYNRRPYYSINLLPYLTDATAFDVASDAMLTVSIRDIGFNLLEGTDRVVITGAAVEEAENTAPSLNVNVFVSGGGGGGDNGGGTGDPVINSAGEVVVNHSGEVVTL